MSAGAELKHLSGIGTRARERNAQNLVEDRDRPHFYIKEQWRQPNGAVEENIAGG
jgi:hypothetical protein